MARWLCFLAIRHVEETFPHTHVVEGTGICFSLSLTQSRLPHMKQEGLEFLLLIFLLLHINNFTDMARYGYRIPQVKNHQLRFLLKRRRHVALGCCPPLWWVPTPTNQRPGQEEHFPGLHWRFLNRRREKLSEDDIKDLDLLYGERSSLRNMQRTNTT